MLIAYILFPSCKKSIESIILKGVEFLVYHMIVLPVIIASPGTTHSVC